MNTTFDLPDAPIAHEGFFATHFFTVRDQEKSKDFYVRILGGKVIKSANPCYIKLANTWIILNSGGWFGFMRSFPATARARASDDRLARPQHSDETESGASAPFGTPERLKRLATALQGHCKARFGHWTRRNDSNIK